MADTLRTSCDCPQPLNISCIQHNMWGWHEVGLSALTHGHQAQNMEHIGHCLTQQEDPAVMLTILRDWGERQSPNVSSVLCIQC